MKTFAPEDQKWVLIDYGDLAGKGFATALLVKNAFREMGHELFVLSVKQYDGVSVTNQDAEATEPPGTFRPSAGSPISRPWFLGRLRGAISHHNARQ